jgi:LAO/AO transport system kinase
MNFLSMDIEKIIKGVLASNKRLVAKTITHIENETVRAVEILDRLYPYGGNAQRIGITGPPGAGKSTFTNQFIQYFRKAGKSIGVIAVDPSSPFTGGAVLGDRLRMQNAVLDEKVFIRSMSTRGNLGGLAKQASEAADVLDAAGMDIIIFETVGVGQVELDIMSAADTVIVLTVPDAGDVIQGMKAGLMEIGDIFVINKSDLEGADKMKVDIEFVLHLREASEWTPPVLLAESRVGKGIEKIGESINNHYSFMKKKGFLDAQKKAKIESKIKRIVNDKMISEFWDIKKRNELQKYLEAKNEKHSPYSVAMRLLKNKN